MLENLGATAAIPGCEVHTTVAAAVLDVFGRVHEVRNTGQAGEETEYDGPQTFPDNVNEREMRRREKKGLLSRTPSLELRSRHSPLPAGRTIDRRGSLCERHNWYCGMVHTRRAHCL